MRESERQKRNYIILGLCTVVLIMAVGFAVFSQQLQINSTSEVTSTWDIEITGIQGANPDGGDAYDITPPTYTPTTATFSTGLITPYESYRVYQVEVSNLGTLTGKVSIASLDCGDNDAIGCGALASDFKFIDEDGEWIDENYYTLDEGNNDYSDIEFTLEPNKKHYIEIGVWYENVETQPDDLSANITLTLNYVQKYIPPAPEPGPTTGEYYVFKNHDYHVGNSFDTLGLIPNVFPNGKKTAVKYVLEDGIITDAYVCSKFDFISEPVCIDSSNGYDTIRSLTSIFTSNGGSCDSGTGESESKYSCSKGDQVIYGYSDEGFVGAYSTSDNEYCREYDGYSYGCFETATGF